MTVQQYLNNNYVPDFRIIVYLNWKTEILYDSTMTDFEIPHFMYDSIVENVYNENGIVEIEI